MNAYGNRETATRQNMTCPTVNLPRVSLSSMLTHVKGMKATMKYTWSIAYKSSDSSGPWLYLVISVAWISQEYYYLPPPPPPPPPWLDWMLVHRRVTPSKIFRMI